MAHFGQHWGICGAPSAPITLGRYSSWPNALSFQPAPLPPPTPTVQRAFGQELHSTGKWPHLDRLRVLRDALRVTARRKIGDTCKHSSEVGAMRVHRVLQLRSLLL